MEIEAITPDIVEAYLGAYQRAEKAPAELLQLHFLQERAFASPKEREFWLFDQMHAWAAEALERCRQYEGLQTPASASPLESLRDDFAPGSQLLESWSAVYYRYLAQTPLRVEKMLEVTPYGEKNLRRRVESGLKEIVKLLSQAEIESHQRQNVRMRGRFIPSPDYTRLFGLDRQVSRLVETVRNSAPNERFFSVEGIGGVGKTTLAQAVAAQLAAWPELDGILWVSAKHEFLNLDGAKKVDLEKNTLDIVSALASQMGLDYLAGLSLEKKLAGLSAALAARKCLLVLDNLETVQDVAQLLPRLFDLAGPSKYLLTSRQAMSNYPQVISFSVEHLSYADAEAFFVHEIERNARRAVKDAIPDGFMPAVYDLVGGIPLALKLIAAQIGRAQPPEQVLQNLRAGKDAQRKDKDAELFPYIYKASWELLGQAARDLLLSMLFVPLEGETLDWIRMNAGVDDDAFPAALNELLNLCLVETTGSIFSPRYFIHRLTATFLKTDLRARWAKAK
ncbi:MAG: NB-ARC domain-containing protein [Anaerolineales bacterium]